MVSPAEYRFGVRGVLVQCTDRVVSGGRGQMCRTKKTQKVHNDGKAEQVHSSFAAAAAAAEAAACWASAAL